MWIAEDRWGNYMGKQRWREALVMDLARGNLTDRVAERFGRVLFVNDARYAGLH